MHTWGGGLPYIKLLEEYVIQLDTESKHCVCSYDIILHVTTTYANY